MYDAFFRFAHVRSRGSHAKGFLSMNENSNQKKPLVVLTGPTAVGKTALSIQLAKRIGGEIISADSMQVYRHMDIGSAKIKEEEMQGIPHYLVNVLEPTEEFHAVRFQQMAKEAATRIWANGHIPIVVGGTGFYIQALLYNIDFSEETDLSYRAHLQQLAEERGNRFLHEMLKQADPKSAMEIHENNRKRLIRALEYYHTSKEPISAHNEAQRRKESPYRFAYLVLTDDRERLYQRIDARVDKMFQEGLLEEVTKLKNMGCHRGMVSMQGLGYKEILSYLEGEVSLEETLCLIKRDTRHFAKRQLTWFRREKEVVWLDKQSYGYDERKILAQVLEILQKKGIIQNV